MNLPQIIGMEDLLKGVDYLGQYGKVEKIIVHRNGTAHVTFATEASAKLCISWYSSTSYLLIKCLTLVIAVCITLFTKVPA